MMGTIMINAWDSGWGCQCPNVDLPHSAQRRKHDSSVLHNDQELDQRLYQVESSSRVIDHYITMFEPLYKPSYSHYIAVIHQDPVVKRENMDSDSPWFTHCAPQGIARQSHHRCCVPSLTGATNVRWSWSGPRHRAALRFSRGRWVNMSSPNGIGICGCNG